MVRRATQTVQENPVLPYLGNQERLDIYNLLITGAQHLWSKNKLQEEKLSNLLNIMVPLTVKDPFFLAHLTSYVFRTEIPNKDLRVMTSYINSLSTADGSPFSPGSKYMKPNLRIVSASAVQKLEPKEALRVTEFEGRKWTLDNYFNLGRHFPGMLRTSLEKYLRYREANPEMFRGITRVGLKEVAKNIYKRLHLAPSDEAAAILRWQQKEKKIELEKREYDFKGKKDLEIAEIIRDKKIPFTGALAELARTGKKISPVIAVALLEQATGNQAVIGRKTFEDAGILKDPEVAKLYAEKVREAKTALDRAETLSKTASEATKSILKTARAESRRESLSGIGKVYIHLDASGSMEDVIEFAKEKGAILAELVPNPQENFAWGMFDMRAVTLPLPDEFVSDAFKAVLFGRTMGGGTDCFALYPTAREFGAEVDVQVTDGGHNVGDLEEKIREYHETHPTIAKPKACVIVDFSHGWWGTRKSVVQDAYEANGISVTVMQPETLENSALVTEAVKVAMKGPMATIDTIMGTELLTLPEWYFTI